MTELKPISNLFALEVPEDIELPSIYTHDGKNELTYWYDDGKEWKDDITLPPGSYEILFTTKSCSEQQAARVVAFDMYEDVGTLAANYMKDSTTDCKSCIESLQSLLRSHNLTGKNYLLIKKQP